MTTTALLPDQRRNIQFVRELGDPSRTFKKQGDSGGETLVIEGKPIFRSGSFADSLGREHEWEEIHLTQMVDHFTLLSSRKIFSDVPIRKGHPDRGGLFGGESRNRMDELVGYITGVTVETRKNPADGAEYKYFLADLEIIEEAAIKAVSSGLWRNMSAEIGAYVTNNNAEYWPCIMGVAYVDIPAVEGLKDHAKADSQFSLILEEGMTQSTLPGNPQPPVPKKEPDLQSFTIGGQTTTDYTAVQAHIARIEQENSDLNSFRRETEESGRERYIDDLARDGKITQPSVDGYKKYAKDLTTEQFSSWKALMDEMPGVQITGTQASGFSSAPNQVSDNDSRAQRIEDLKGIISMHQMAQMPKEKLEKTAAFVELSKLDPNFAL